MYRSSIRRGAISALCSLLLLSVPGVSASDFLIYIRNTCKTPLSYMLFQKAEDPSINSYSHAWKVGNLGSPGYEGPHVLPEDVQVGIKDTDTTDAARSTVPRFTGPYPADFGNKFVFTLPSAASSPLLKKSQSRTIDGSISISNNADTYKPVAAVIFKNGTPLVSENNVRPRAEAIIKIEPKLYINYIEPGSYQEGDSFRAVTIGSSAEVFELDPGSPSIYIEASCESNGSIDFNQVDGFGQP